MNTHASFWEAVVGALQSLRGSKLRSFLTLLGIILATTTLIAVMSVIYGMDVYIAENVSDMGADGFRVVRIVMMQCDPKKFLEMQRRNPQLSRRSSNSCKARATLVREIGMDAEPQRDGALRQGDRWRASQLDGVTPNIGGHSATTEVGTGPLPHRNREQAPPERSPSSATT